MSHRIFVDGSTAIIGGETVEWDDTFLTLTPPDNANRIDRVYVDDTGTVDVVIGETADIHTRPPHPDIPDNSVYIKDIWHIGDANSPTQLTAKLDKLAAIIEDASGIGEDNARANRGMFEAMQELLSGGLSADEIDEIDLPSERTTDTFGIITDQFRAAGGDALQADDSIFADANIPQSVKDKERATTQMFYLVYVALTGDRVQSIEDGYFPVQ